MRNDRLVPRRQLSPGNEANPQISVALGQVNILYQRPTARISLDVLGGPETKVQVGVA